MSALKILSYNIHKGFSWDGRSYILNPLRKAIRETQAQVVFLQEVAGISSLHSDVQFEYLADSVWTHYAYGKNALTDLGHHGNATLSLFPFQHWSNHPLTTNPFEQRGLLHGTVQWQEAPLHLLNTHLNLLEGGRREQVRWIQAYLQTNIPHGERVILAGDFNDWTRRGLRAFTDQGLQEAHLEHQGSPGLTFPALRPFLSLDRVYTRGFSVVSARTLVGEPWKKLSDHLPLLIELSA